MSKNTESNGVGFLGLLLLLFIAFKICGVIAWSWWWVTAPLWFPAVIAIVSASICGIYLLTKERK